MITLVQGTIWTWIQDELSRSAPLSRLLTTWLRRIPRRICEVRTKAHWRRSWRHNLCFRISGKSSRCRSCVRCYSSVSYFHWNTSFCHGCTSSHDLFCCAGGCVRKSCLCPKGRPSRRSFSLVARGLRGPLALLRGHPWPPVSYQSMLWRKNFLLALSKMRWAIIYLQGQPGIRNWISTKGFQDECKCC